MNLKNFERTCARDGSHGRHGQCGALAEHRSDSGVADSPAPQGRAQHRKIISPHFFADAESALDGMFIVSDNLWKFY
ncbi:MAG: hypothetical protein NZ529_09135 [Cytophagaceae bacterium]|nr:hypothetical protein [Cytophagaceae bacterium]MDW8456948.1 hypothetical protein [Cytophagaceae bacterium]